MDNEAVVKSSQRPPTREDAQSAVEESTDFTTTNAVEATSHSENTKEQPGKPSSVRGTRSTTATALLLGSILISAFVVALDRTIIATAVPRISDEFNSFSDIGWYGSAYLLTCCALQLLYGKVYTIFPLKHVLLINILLFEVASVISGAAPNSVAFIIGRAICGVGAAGILAGVIICIADVVPLPKRPLFQALFGALMGIASVTGPLIGGGFTSNVTWRWCFYINLPIGGIAMVATFFFLDVTDRETTRLPMKEKLTQLDVLGTAAIVPGVVCLLLALQWGGQTYRWDNSRIIALLTVSGVLWLAFAIIQILLPKTATLPPRVFKQRSVAAALWTTICLNCGSYIILYFLPLWFQAIKGVTAAESGIRTLPLMISMIAGVIGGGVVNSKIGYYTPLAILGSCIMSVGCGLLTTFQVDTGEGKWIGYQVLYGFGLGMVFQVPNLAAQTCLPKEDTPMGLTLMLFGSGMAATMFVAVGENVLANQLVQRLSWVPGFDPSLVTSGGATSFLNSLPPNLRSAGFLAYNEAIRKTFQVGLIPTCLTVLGTFALEWKSVKDKPQAQPAAETNRSSKENAREEKGIR